jgi:hypothetical protein
VEWTNALKRPYAIEKIQYQGTGKLQAEVDSDLTVGRLPLHMSEAEHLWPFVDNAFPRKGRFGPSAPLYYSLWDTMLRAVDDLLVKKEIRLHMDHEPLSRAYVAYKDMLLDMDHLGWFSEADKIFSMSVLNHGTINDKQILVERTGDASSPWRLSGIIGFDDAETVPAVLNKRPWSWVWDVHEVSEVLPNQNQFGCVLEVDEVPVEPPYFTEHDLKVKQRYEDVLIEKLYVLQYGDKARDQCFDDTYGRGRWLRRLFYFAQEDVVYASSKHRFNKLVHDWKQFKKDMNIQSRPLELWERLPDYIHGTEDEKPGPVQPPAAPVVINNSNTAPSSSLQHVYFFINSQTSSPDTQAATDHDLV